MNGSWKGDGTVGGQLWMSPETWVRNSAFLLKREDGAERPTAVYVSMIQSELDEPNKKVQADGGAGTDDLAAGTAGGHMRACVHSSMLVRMRFDIFRCGIFLGISSPPPPRTILIFRSGHLRRPLGRKIPPLCWLQASLGAATALY